MNPNSFRYYRPEEQGLQIYHNQPVNNHDVGLVDLKDKSILDFNMKVINDNLLLSHKNNTLVKVENWNTYQPGREMMFAFNDTTVANAKCIFSACNSKDVIEDFNKEKVTLLKEHMFDAIVQNNINEAKGLIRKIESINTESKHELTPLYVAIQEGRLDIVEILFERKHFSVKDKDIYGCNPLHWAAQQGNLNIAKFLVERGADIGAKDKNGRTSLRIAACNGSLDIVKFFLDKNASIEAKSNDPYKMMGIVKSAKKEIINQADTSSNVRRWAEFFVEELRYSIRSVTKEKLKDGMLRNRYSSVNELANEIYKSDGKLFDDIIKGVINEVYGRVDTKEILSYVRSHNNVDQSISGYVAVFDAMQRNGDLNNSAIFKLAYSIKEATSFDKYSSLDSEKRSDLKRLKSKLPESVKNIVFASKVCIKNIDHNEYLYAASNYLSYDDDRRRVFTWIPKDEKDDKFRWEIKLDGDDYSIMNVEFNEYLYGAVDYFNYDNERRKVFTWIPGGRVGRDTWKIEPIGSSCYIMNVELNEYLYAAVDHFNYDDERRRVFTWIPKNSKSDQFKWNIEDCGHAVKRRDISSSHTDLNSDTTRSSRKAELDKELLSATKIGNLSEVKNLVNQGASVDAEDKDGNTPFHNAALKGYLTIAQYLVEKGVDVNASNEDGWTPMHGSALKGHLEVVRFLIEKGANISAENIFGEKPIHCAAKRNNKDIIEVLLRKGASINDADKNGRTPLYFASWNGYLGLVEYFVRDKKANINIKDKYGKTPLDVAIDRNHISVIGYLSKKQLELCKELLVVVQSGDLSKVQDLVNQGASLDIQSEDGLTLLHFAFINNRLDIAGYLIKEGVDINVRDNDGATCLHYVSRFGRLNAVKYLISKGADIDAEDSNDRTPLDVADSSIIKILRQAHLDKELLITVQSSDLERIKSLIAQGVSKDEHGAYYFAWIGNLGTVKFIVENEGGVNVTDKYGCTLLHWAARGGHLEIVKFLLEKGANINAKDILGRTPIHFAVMNNHVNITEFLLNQGVSVDETDKNGSTPLHYAAEFSELDSATFLIEKGANINTADNSGKKPIHVASENNNKNIIELFLSKGVSVDNADKDGWTSLHYAARRGCLGATEFLIEKGADTKAKDKNGQVPLCVAAQYNKSDIIDFLLNRGATIEASDFNDGPILKLAYCIKEVMEKINNKEQISHFEELKNKLPESIKNAVFSSKVCIKNLYQNEYLYAASSDFNYDDKRRRVFTWIPGDKKDGELKWKIEPYGDSYSIMNVEFNEYLYAASDDLNYDKDRRRVFTWVPGGKDEQSLWRVEPYGDDIYIMNVKSKEYLYAADYAKYDDNRRRVFTWIPGEYIRQGTWKIENCGSIHKKRDIQELDGKAGSDSLEAIRARNKSDSQLLEPVHNLLRSKAVKARTTICRLVLSLRSQFFHNRLHFSSQAKERSTTHLFGNTTKVCNSLRFITSTVAGTFKKVCQTAFSIQLNF